MPQPPFSFPRTETNHLLSHTRTRRPPPPPPPLARLLHTHTYIHTTHVQAGFIARHVKGVGDTLKIPPGCFKPDPTIWTVEVVDCVEEPTRADALVEVLRTYVAEASDAYKVCGFDAEWDTAKLTGTGRNEAVGVVQLSVFNDAAARGVCVLFFLDVKKRTFPAELLGFICATPCCGFRVRGDLSILNAQYKLRQPYGMPATAHYFDLIAMSPPDSTTRFTSLKNASSLMLSVDVYKPTGLADQHWSKDTLTRLFREYAATDSIVSLGCVLAAQGHLKRGLLLVFAQHAPPSPWVDSVLKRDVMHVLKHLMDNVNTRHPFKSHLYRLLSIAFHISDANDYRREAERMRVRLGLADAEIYRRLNGAYNKHIRRVRPPPAELRARLESLMRVCNSVPPAGGLPWKKVSFDKALAVVYEEIDCDLISSQVGRVHYIERTRPGGNTKEFKCVDGTSMAESSHRSYLAIFPGNTHGSESAQPRMEMFVFRTNYTAGVNNGGYEPISHFNPQLLRLVNEHCRGTAYPSLDKLWGHEDTGVRYFLDTLTVNGTAAPTMSSTVASVAATTTAATTTTSVLPSSTSTMNRQVAVAITTAAAANATTTTTTSVLPTSTTNLQAAVAITTAAANPTTTTTTSVLPPSTMNRQAAVATTTVSSVAAAFDEDDEDDDGGGSGDSDDSDDGNAFEDGSGDESDMEEQLGGDDDGDALEISTPASAVRDDAGEMAFVTPTLRTELAQAMQAQVYELFAAKCTPDPLRLPVMNVTEVAMAVHIAQQHASHPGDYEGMAASWNNHLAPLCIEKGMPVTLKSAAHLKACIEDIVDTRGVFTLTWQELTSKEMRADFTRVRTELREMTSSTIPSIIPVRQSPIRPPVAVPPASAVEPLPGRHAPEAGASHGAAAMDTSAPPSKRARIEAQRPDAPQLDVAPVTVTCPRCGKEIAPAIDGAVPFLLLTLVEAVELGNSAEAALRAAWPPTAEHVSFPHYTSASRNPTQGFCPLVGDLFACPRRLAPSFIGDYKKQKKRAQAD